MDTESSNPVDCTPAWGPVLLIGGAGRLGYYIAQHLLSQHDCTQVVSISRNKSIAHRFQGVEYRNCDIRDESALHAVIREIQPQTIINVAAPAHTNTLTSAIVYEEVFVEAQDNLIRLAKEVGTEYMICTTSSSVAAGYEHVQVDETATLWPEDSKAFAYWVQRARAERRLLAADSSTFQTVSLRLPLIIGERDYAFVPSLIDTLRTGNTSFQIGNDAGLLATVSAKDAARAHILALKEVMKPSNEVHGEAFYIIGPKPLSFWTMARIVWSEAGWIQDKAPTIIPEWIARIVAATSEVLLRPFGREPHLSTHVIRFMCGTWTYNGRKACDVLGYKPQSDTEEELRRSVRWYLRTSQIASEA